uniref:F-box domain-containing protein n=1 Tax=Oryza glumipatula TaxID=40148 RepID=A0A0E0BNG3_9ORYZ
MKQSRREEGDDDVSVGKKEEEAGYCSSSSISRLPEACLAHAISFTTPTDACRCSAVSADFQAAASSNAVWERFLPPDYHSILARADDPCLESKNDLNIKITAQRRPFYLILLLKAAQQNKDALGIFLLSPLFAIDEE